jgi:uncharacterized membrane protein
MILKEISETIKRWFVAGILILVPAVVTYLVLAFLFEKVDSLLHPALDKLLGYQIPGLGILILVLVILLLGMLGRSVIGRKIVTVWEKFLIRLPITRTLYSASKQLLETFTVPDTSAYKRVVLVEYPKEGVFVLAFSARDTTLMRAGIEGDFCAVFIPSTPTPFTGFVAMIKKNNIFPIEMSVEEALKFLVSGGIATPGQFLVDNKTKVE